MLQSTIVKSRQGGAVCNVYLYVYRIWIHTRKLWRKKPIKNSDMIEF